MARPHPERPRGPLHEPGAAPAQVHLREAWQIRALAELVRAHNEAQHGLRCGVLIEFDPDTPGGVVMHVGALQYKEHRGRGLVVRSRGVATDPDV